MKHILITGGAGFIGSHLVDRLLSEGDWQVTIVDDFNDFYEPSIKRDNIRAHAQNPSLKVVQADIRDPEALEGVFPEELDCIVHLAARAGVRPSLSEPKLYAETNIDGTLNLLELARARGAGQFVFGSSSSVYGLNAKVPFSEDDPICNPISPYAATKAAGELICHTYSHLYDMKIVCLRFFTVYGARQRPDLAIHLGESRTVELRELIALLEDALDRQAQIDWQPAQPGDVPQTFADITKARRLLGYNPQTQIEEGIRKFVEWFRQRQG